MSMQENLQTLEKDTANTKHDFEKTIKQVSQTVKNARARFDPMRVMASHPYAAGAAVIAIGAFLGFRGRSSKEFLTPAARALIASAATSAFWAALNR